jgi:hypothetical protein
LLDYLLKPDDKTDKIWDQKSKQQSKTTRGNNQQFSSRAAAQTNDQYGFLSPWSSANNHPFSRLLAITQVFSFPWDQQTWREKPLPKKLYNKKNKQSNTYKR